jgi:hypothetical protein
MPANEEMMRQMDEAAEQAEIELDQNLDNWLAKDIISWWFKWYMRAGHKRLGRLLVARGKKRSNNNSELPF